MLYVTILTSEIKFAAYKIVLKCTSNRMVSSAINNKFDEW